MSGMRTKTNPNQLHFDFAPTRPDYLVQAPFGPPRLPGENLGDYILRYIAPAPVVEPVEAVAGTNATFEVSPGSFRRVHYLGDTHHGRYCQIQFPGATYSTGQPRIQSVNRAVVTPDPF
jgi:hypothetical protein